jgi:hypothetical protein
MTAANKGYSYPRIAAIQIDVHPTGKTPTNTPHTSHAQSAYDLRPYISHVVNAKQSFTKSSIAMDRATAPEKRAPDTIYSTMADRSVGPYPISLSSQPLKQWR